MKKLNLEQMEKLEGGRMDAVEAACTALAMGTGAHLLGVAVNLWNPIGVGWGLFWAASGIACVVYSATK